MKAHPKWRQITRKDERDQKPWGEIGDWVSEPGAGRREASQVVQTNSPAQGATYRAGFHQTALAGPAIASYHSWILHTLSEMERCPVYPRIEDSL
jgi:hypothetical protein